MGDTETAGFGVPVLGFIAPSGTGKTTLLEQVIAYLAARGLRIGVVKQAREDFDVDVPGKDSYVLRKAGVERLMIASRRKSALIVEHPGGGDPQLATVLGLLDRTALDLVLVEGFSAQPFPKIELRRQGQGEPRHLRDPWVIAVACDRPEPAAVPLLDLNDPAAVCAFVLAWWEHARRAAKST
ncbi:MAG TPA: molybdopterin-guanine dinucleotide biosynthesis protein B [Candidatus Competibacteraceae bacterium]|nr:molybdopterin-guanine dinucleotide biosynthesis protein B [Candidatus Competibacteraceae bacterium]